MARFSQQEQNQMRQDAMRRANEMHGRVPFSAPAARQRGDYPPQETERVPKQTEQAGKNAAAGRKKGLPELLPQWNPAEPFSKLDGDSVLILALMAMLYKEGGLEGCDKKLLMALAYLLT